MKRWRTDQGWSSAALTRDDLRKALASTSAAAAQMNSLDEDEPDSSLEARIPELNERLEAISQLTAAAQDDFDDGTDPRQSSFDGAASESVEEYKKKLLMSVSGLNVDGIIEDDEGADHAEPPSIPWRPQNVQSTCEFTHVIEDYQQKRDSGCKKAEYSAITVDEFGNKWRLIVYVNGNGRASNNHLSLFLQVADADDLPFGWKKAVSYVLTLEHPNGGNLSYAKRNPDKTFKLCPKAIDWGWSQFITSDRIQQEGFVMNDSLIVRASVTVKSSSVSIDEEDAELYLKCAVEEGDVDAVRLCLDHGAKVNCKFKDDLYTPLHTACSSGTNTGSMDVLNLLLEKGADGNACNKWQETPLLIAANNGHRAAVEALLKHGANPNLSSEAGWSALTFAAHKGYEDIVALLLKAGAPVNCEVTEDSSTPLHKACAGSKPGHLASVKLLIEAGADVHSLNKWRETPLLTAANHGQAGAVEALLRAGADPCKCTDTGWSPLSIAAYKGHDDVVRLLLEEGAPTEEDDPTLSALLQAATKGLPETVELLLQHGADHTVTTKKGDTALSILVEQNLIDAAVEMVTVYNASIPRCSRDRKKVQRARLLINLRMKQMEREAKSGNSNTDDDETDIEDSNSIHAQHDEVETNSNGMKNGKKKGKNTTSSTTAEERARAAEEALLLELEQEDAKAKKEEAEANSKRAKKKKKKEREKLQKLKEEQEKRDREQREAEERERQRKEKEELQRREREQKEKEKKELEMLEREKFLAAKRKEREDRERREKEVKKAVEHPKKAIVSSGSPGSANGSERRGRPPRGRKTPVGSASSVISSESQPTDEASHSPPGTGGAPVRNRGWETSLPSRSPVTPSPDAHNQVASPDSFPELTAPIPTLSKSIPSTALSPKPIEHQQSDILPMPSLRISVNSDKSVRGFASIEHPAIFLLRREKMIGLFNHCRSINILNDTALKRIIYRWILRNSHGKSEGLDPIIPSWADFKEMEMYFQRQFIAECKRGQRSLPHPQVMERLKEAGSSVAAVCQSFSNEIVQLRRELRAQFQIDLTDSYLGMTSSDGTTNGTGTVISVSFANRYQVHVPVSTFRVLRERYIGPPNRFLTTVFVAKVWDEIETFLTSDSGFNVALTIPTKSSLSAELMVSAELFSSPFSVYSNCVFWGRINEVDSSFGGQLPFGKLYDEETAPRRVGGEEVLAEHGGSVSVLVPADPIVAARYMRRMVDLLDTSSARTIPLSFAAFLPCECFSDTTTSPTVDDLSHLDDRLGGIKRLYLTYVRQLPGGEHFFQSGNGPISETRVSSSTTLFVLMQNKAGKERFAVQEDSIARIINSMSTTRTIRESNPNLMSLGFRPDVANQNDAIPRGGSYQEQIARISPTPQHVLGAGFATISESFLKPFSPSNEIMSRGSRHGRLFELVDDVEEDPLGDVDIVSGMLNNLDVGLFQGGNANSDVDIEAISLMGIGGTMQHRPNNPNAFR